MKKVAVILASGNGQRMGMPEAVLEYEKGKSFLRWLSSTFSKVGCETLGVIPRGAEDIRERHPEAYLVEETSPDGAVRAGIRAALEEGAEAVVLHTVARPAVRSSTVEKLLKELNGMDGVVPDFEGAAGQPLILTRQGAEKVLLMDGDSSLAGLVPRLELRRITTRDPGILVTLDTPEMYERILGSKPHAAPMPKRRTRKLEEDAGEPSSL
jgi:molybdenum cofactor cytidylyltransferase